MVNDADGSFGERLRHFRVLRGYSQVELARAAGLSQRKLSDIERGKRAPLLLPHQFMAIARHLDVTLALLAGVAPAAVTTEHLTLPVVSAELLRREDITVLCQVAQQLAQARAEGSVTPQTGARPRGARRTRGRLAALAQVPARNDQLALDGVPVPRNSSRRS